jgi:hypothetical protein
VLASRGVDPGVDPNEVAAKLRDEAQQVYTDAWDFEFTASCPALMTGPGAKLRLASAVGPFVSSSDAVQRCASSPHFLQTGCYVAHLRQDQVPEELDVMSDGTARPRSLGYRARAADWPIYQQPDSNTTVVGSTHFRYQALTVKCQRTGPLVLRGGESSNVWDRIEQSEFTGWISDIGVIGTPLTGLDARLAGPCP